MLGEPYQVLADCPHCLVEAAISLIMDPAHPASHMGHPVERRCRMCAWAIKAHDEPFHPHFPLHAARCPACRKPLSEPARGGEAPCPHCDYAPSFERVHAPIDLREPLAASEALRRWAAEDGEPDPDAFTQANMGRSAQAVIELLVAHEPVPTTFDVIAFLFPTGGGAAAEPDGAARAQAPTVVDRPAQTLTATPAPRQATEDPRVAARVLVSVMVADGALRDDEHHFIRAYLERESLPPMDPRDIRVWRPQEFPRPRLREDRERILRAAVDLMHLDHQRDGSEWKVVRAFAGAWGVTDAQLTDWDREFDARYGTVLTRLWSALSTLVRIH